MAALFTAASTQYLINSAPAVLDYPISVGMWINLAAVGASARTLWALSDTGTTNNYLMLRMTAGELISAVARAGGTESAASVATAITAGSWCFAVGKFLSSTERRSAVLHANGLVEFGSSAAARVPTGMDTMTIGALSTSGGITEPWDGLIGEYWLLNADATVAPAAGWNADSIFQLAYGGPFSNPRLADKIIEYRSFRKYPSSEGDEIGEVYHGMDRQTWTNTNGVTISHHPPLPYWYEKPGQHRRLLVA